MKKNYIFVYGTLMEGHRNYYKYIKDNAVKIERCYTYGKLYHLKKRKCPAIIQGNDKVFGQYITVTDNDKNDLLKVIDEFEKYFECDNIKKVAFQRKKINIYLDGKQEETTAYFFVKIEELNANDSVYIKYGDWNKYIKDNNINLE